jgi:serine/threonine-protein kinase
MMTARSMAGTGNDPTRCAQCGAGLEPGAAHDCPPAARELRSTTAATPRTKAAGVAPRPRGGPVSVRQTAPLLAPAPALPAPASRLGAQPVAAGAVAADEGFDPLIGTLLGEHYRIIERLGAGGMGTVYLVTHVHLKKKSAAKILNTETARRPDALARFQQEAVSASRLDHENIVDVVNFGSSEDGTVYLVMEFLKGEPLNQILAKGPLGFDDAVRIMVPVCRGLAAAHGAGIVHRDLKPENVFVARRSGRHVVKLLDFGVSKIKERSLEERRLTQTGDVLGSPLYMSPEASRGEADVDGRADIYAVGVMLYEMTTGRVPFTADNYLQVLYKHIQETPEPPRAHDPAIPEALAAAILRCLEKDPAARYQHIEELEAALLAAVPGVDLDAPVSAAAPSHLTSMDVPLPISGSRTPITHLTPAPTAARLPVAAPARRPSSRIGLYAGFAGTLGLLIFAGFSVWRARRHDPPTPVVIPGPPAALPAAEPVARVAPPPTPAPVKAELSVESTPAGASVTLDGEAIGATPLVHHVEPDARERTLRLELGGFRVETRQVVLDRSRAIGVALKKVARERSRRPALDIKEGR